MDATKYSRPIGKDATIAVGATPLVKLQTISKDLPATIAVKLEYMNPTCSVKDRAATSMIEDAERNGRLVKGQSVIMEGTSGNMGIALAALAAMKGYKCILVMPSSMSIERRALFKAYGAELILTDPAEGFTGINKRLDELAKVIPHAFLTSQFSNPANPAAHYRSTGPEIWQQTNGEVDIVCFGIGTGGTITGVGNFLKEQKPSVEVYAIEPEESAVLSGNPRGPHKIQGIGAGIIPDVLDRNIYKEIIKVNSEDSLVMARRLAEEEGILGGISSGANVVVACRLAQRPENKGKLIVTTVNSYGERYLSTDLYQNIIKDVQPLTFMSLEESVERVKKFLSL